MSLAKRARARRLRRRASLLGVTDEHFGQLFARIAERAPVWFERPDEDEGEMQTEMRAFAAGLRRSNGVGFDPATIVLIVQICLLIYQVLKEMGYLSREPLTLAAVHEVAA